MADVEVAVVGAGAAGLGVAVALARRGVADVAVMESADSVGASWRARYEGLRLNTLRRMSSLPGKPMPRAAGRWVAKEDFVAHLEDAAARHRLDIRLGTEVRRIERHGEDWRLTTSAGSLTARSVVVATGRHRAPYLPDWPGSPSFSGELIHANAFHSSEPFRGKDVLVVGVGNSGTEIATQLSMGGAGRVRVAMRRSVNILPQSFLGVPLTMLARASEPMPVAMVDVMGYVMQRVAWGNLARYGMHKPAWGIGTELRHGSAVVVIDKGFVPALKAGRVTLVAGVEALDGSDVVLTGGSRIQPDVVIAATGYRHGLESLVGHLGVLLPSGRPAVMGDRTHAGAPRLYFNGYWLPYSGELPAMRRTSRRVARAIAHGPPASGHCRRRLTPSCHDSGDLTPGPLRPDDL